MADNLFEQRVRGQMEEFRFSPSAAVWTTVEARLRQKRRRRRFLFLLLLPLIATGGLLLGRALYPAPHQAMPHNTTTVAPPTPATHSIPAASTATPATASPAAVDAPATTATTATASTPAVSTTAAPATAIAAMQLPAASASQSRPVNRPSGNASRAVASTRPRRAQPAVSSSIINTPPANDAGRSDIVPAQPAPAPDNTTRSDVTDSSAQDISLFPASPVAATSPAVDSAAAKVDSSATVPQPKKTDSLQKLPPALVPPPQRLRNPRPVRLGFIAMAGRVSEVELLRVNLGAVKSGVNNAGFNNVIIPTNNFSVTSYPPEPGLGLAAGLLVEKQVTKNSYIQSGLNYLALRNKYFVGGQIDSAARFFIVNPVQDGNGNLVSYNTLPSRESYVPGGDTYTSTYHWIELPLTYHTRITRIGKNRLMGYGGLSYAVLLASNALVYDQTQNIYVSGGTFFRRSQLSALAGLSLRFDGKKMHHTSIGPFVRYGLNRITSQYVGDRRTLLYYGIRVDLLLWKL
jgi:hypothetical protein